MEIFILKSDNEVYRPALPAIFRGILTAAAITLVSMLVCALVMTFASLNENAVFIAMHITSLAAVFIGSLAAASRINKNGMINGMIVGILYAFLMMFTGFMTTPDYTLTAKTLLTFGICIAGGALGGILGVNIK